MSPKRMKGFIDPISLGFVIAMLGTAAVLSLDKADADVDVAAQGVQASELEAPLVASQD
jgi:hypothetical protein